MTEPYYAVLKVETTGGKDAQPLCITLYDISRAEMIEFNATSTAFPLADGIAAAVAADILIVHTPYALTILERTAGVKFDRSKIIDTCALAEQYAGTRGNGLSAWAKRMGYDRREFSGAPSWSRDIQDRCNADAVFIAALLERFQTIRDKMAAD